MDIQALKTFLAVAKSGSFSRAAQALHLTQPAVSKRIALLEQQLEVKLIDRLGRKIALTEAGDLLIKKAHTILNELEDTRRSLKNLTGNITGTLSLGISHHLGLHRLPSVLQEFSAFHPEVHLDIKFLDSEVAYQAVVRGEIELGVITLSTDSMHHIKAQPVWKDTLNFVCAQSHPLASTRHVDLESLARYGCILPDLTTFTAKITAELFRQHRLPLTISMCTNYLETIRMMVSIGLGWSLLPATLSTPPLTVLDVPGISLHRNLGAIYHQDRTLSNSARAFLNILARHSSL